MDMPKPHQTAASYSAALKSPPKVKPPPTSTTKVPMKVLNTQRTQISGPPASLSASGSKLPYSSIAGASPQQPPTPPRKHTVLRAPMSAGFFSSAKPRTPKIQPKKDYRPLEWRTKEPKMVSYDWDPEYLAAGAAKYAEEKRENERAKRPATAGNGLISAVNTHQRTTLGEQAKETTELPAQTRSSGLHADVERAARDGAAKYGSGRLPPAPADTRIEDFMTTRPVQTTAQAIAAEIMKSCKNSSTNVTETKPSYISKPAIPFNRSSYSDCRSWLTHYDEVTKDAQGRPVLPDEPWPEDLPSDDEEATHSSEDESVITQVYVGRSGLNQGFGHDGSSHGHNYDASDAKSQNHDGSELRGEAYPQGSQSPSRVLLYWQHPLDLKDSMAKTVPRQLYYPQDGISYTQTKTWTSPIEDERVRFNKIQANARHAGFGQSPFLPKTLDEYLVHKHHYATSQQRSLDASMQEKKKAEEAAQQHLREGGHPVNAMPVPVKFPHWLNDLEKKNAEASPDMSCASVWSNRPLTEAEAAWPTCSEYKARGGEMGKALYGNYFPEPRSITLAKEHHPQLQGQNPLPFMGTRVPWDKREIANYTKHPEFNVMYKPEDLSEAKKPTELGLSEIHPVTAKFIADTEPDNDGDE